MSAPHQHVALLRRLYTGKTVQQSRRAIAALPPDAAPIPDAVWQGQQRLESLVLLGLLEYRQIYTRYPLGIAAVQPESDGISLRVENEERAVEILFNLLPTYAAGQEVHGVPGLRIVRRNRTAVELCVLGEPTSLRLTGLPARIWRSAEGRTLDRWIDPNSMQLCWRSSPRAWTMPEYERHAQGEDESDSFMLRRQHGTWLGSGLLRRVALFHTVSNTFLLDGYQGDALRGTRLLLRFSQVREHGPGPHNIVAALMHPVFGLPLHLKRFRGDTDEGRGGDQQFVLGDPNETAVLDLRASAERPPARLAPELWQVILRRLPDISFAGSLSPVVLASLCGLGAP